MTQLVQKSDSPVLSEQSKTPNQYENMPIHIYRKNLTQKIENFQIKTANTFLISAQNIDCGYSLEPPRRGGSNE